MSIIKSIKQVLGLSGTASENHFWDGSVPNQLTLRKGTPEAPGTELIKALNGALSFPNQGQSLTGNGYVKLPGGLIVQWGTSVFTIAGAYQVFPIVFPTSCLNVVAVAKAANNTFIGVDTFNTDAFRGYSSGGDFGATWIAIGY